MMFECTCWSVLVSAVARTVYSRVSHSFLCAVSLQCHITKAVNGSALLRGCTVLT